MGNPHDCETFDFPLKAAAFSFTVTVKIVFGGTWAQAVQEAIAKAREQATTAGENAMKGETCAGDCECIYFVDVSVVNIAPFKDPGKKKVQITVNGTWQAGILCVKPPKKGKDEGKKGGKGEGKGGDGPKEKQGDKGNSGDSGDKPKDKGKPKSGKKHRK